VALTPDSKALEATAIPSAAGLSNDPSLGRVQFLQALSESLYQARQLIADDPKLLDLRADSAVYAAAEEAVLGALNKGGTYDSPRFVEEFGLDVGRLRALGSDQIVLNLAIRPSDPEVVKHLLAGFRPQLPGALDSELFERMAPQACLALAEGNPFRIEAGVRHFNFPDEIAQYAELLPKPIYALARDFGIASITELGQRLAGTPALSEWTKAYCQLTRDLDEIPGVRFLDRDLPLGPAQIIVMRLLDLDPTAILNKAAIYSPQVEYAEAGVWRPSFEEVEGLGKQKMFLPTSASLGFCRFGDGSSDFISLASISLLFEREGFKFPPSRFPGTLTNLVNFSPSDWEHLRASPEPLISLHCICNSQTVERVADSELAAVRALPLVHTTSYSSLVSFVYSETLLSHRAASAAGLIGKTAGASFTEDRNLGLDTLVFLDFGRASSARTESGSVRIKFSSSVLQQPGAFVTSHDYLDFVAKAGSSEYEVALLHAAGNSDGIEAVRARQAKAYLADVTCGEAALNRVAALIAAANLSIEKFAAGAGDGHLLGLTMGGDAALGFRPPEVKIPTLHLKDVVSIEFDDEVERSKFLSDFPKFAGLVQAFSE
jgi:hypothetical protein